MAEQAYVCEVCQGKVVPTNGTLDVGPSVVRVPISKVLQCTKCGLVYIDLGDTWVRVKRGFTTMERTKKLLECSKQPEA